MLAIMAAHGSPYVAQIAPNKWKDMVKKIQRGFDTKGPVFINAMSACTTEWKFPIHQTIEVSDMATDSLVFPLYEIIDGKELKKGTYALFTIPGKEAWDIILYTDTNNWGVPREWDPTKVAVQFRVTPLQMPMPIETLTITFDDLTYNSAVIGILWENTYVGLPFGTPTDAMVSKNIDQVMAGPTAQDFYTAADYYLSTNKDIQIAQKWIDKAVALSADQPRFWFLRKQALIHAKAGNLKTAIAAAKASLKYATRIAR